MIVPYLVFNVDRAQHLASEGVQISVDKIDLFPRALWKKAVEVLQDKIVAFDKLLSTSRTHRSKNCCIAISTLSANVIKLSIIIQGH